MGEANTVSGAVLFPVVIAAFYVWQVVAWVAARGRWERLYAEVPLLRRPRQPCFMDGVTWRLGCLLQDGACFLRALGRLLLTALPVLSGGALLVAVLTVVAVPLVPAYGLLGGLLAGAVVFAGVSVPFIKAMDRLSHPPSAPQRGT